MRYLLCAATITAALYLDSSFARAEDDFPLGLKKLIWPENNKHSAEKAEQGKQPNFNKRLARDGLLFGPDPSSGDMCKLGGMLANNSSGPHTLRYGAVKDNVEALRVCLQSGEWLDAKSYGLDDSQCSQLLETHRPLHDLKSV